MMIFPLFNRTGRFTELKESELTGLHGAPSADQASPQLTARLPNFLGLKSPAPEMLRSWRLAIIAAGSVGRRIALHAARMQPHTLWIVDPSRYKGESLLTQEILPREIGELKAESVAKACKAISPKTNVFYYAGRVQELPQNAFADAHHVAVSTDNLKAEVEIGQRCLHLAVPLAHAGVHGDTQVAQVRFWANRDGEGPCPACGFGPEEWDHVNRETLFRCVGDDGSPEEKTHVAPTMSTSFLCSLAADLTLMQLMRNLLGLGKSVEDTLLQYCGYTHQTIVSPLKRKADCPCEHITWTRITPPKPLIHANLNDLFEAAGMNGERTNTDLMVGLMVGERTFIESAWCCGQSHSIAQFVASEQELPNCPSCGKKFTLQPYYQYAAAPAGLLDNAKPLDQLGGADAHYAVLRTGEKAFLFQNPL